MIDWILILVWMAVVLIGIPVHFYRKGYVDGYQERMKYEELEKPVQIRWHTMHTEN